MSKKFIFFQGSNEKIICLSEKEFGDENGKVGYMWMQDGEPLITEIPYLYYEDLYLGGSMLRINNIQVSFTSAFYIFIVFFQLE